jgi:hypothetical protein
MRLLRGVQMRMLVRRERVCQIVRPAIAKEGMGAMTGLEQGRGDQERVHPVVTLAESDYRFGAGSLRLAVRSVAWSAPQQLDGKAWYQVDGIEVGDDGRRYGPRSVLVQASCLAGLYQNRAR